MFQIERVSLQEIGALPVGKYTDIIDTLKATPEGEWIKVRVPEGTTQKAFLNNATAALRHTFSKRLKTSTKLDGWVCFSLKPAPANVTMLAA